MQHVREVALGIAAMLWTSSSFRWGLGSSICAYFDASTLAECGGGREGGTREGGYAGNGRPVGHKYY